MKLQKLAAAVVFTLATTVAHGGQFDPDGTGSAPAINLGMLDWGPTSFLALGGNTAIVGFVSSGGRCLANSCNFDVLTQARLIGTFAPGGAPNTPPGLNTTFEITMVGRFTETVTGVSGTGGPGTFATFTGVPNTGFLQLYASAPNAVDVSGFDFSDGRLILNAVLANSPTGNFSITADDPTVCPTTPCDLDRNTGDGNQYTGQFTVSGIGTNSTLTFRVTGQDPTFF